MHIYILPPCSTPAARLLNPAGTDAQSQRSRCATLGGILTAIIFIRLANLNTSFLFWHEYLHGASEDRVKNVFEKMIQDTALLWKWCTSWLSLRKNRFPAETVSFFFIETPLANKKISQNINSYLIHLLQNSSIFPIFLVIYFILFYNKRVWSLSLFMARKDRILCITIILLWSL